MIDAIDDLIPFFQIISLREEETLKDVSICFGYNIVHA